ncbi:MAG TPA: hypothetical protein VLA03_08905, partial [Draconibacterium sp.]|nr:hypothetical protein [Draconibacterium sp.]
LLQAEEILTAAITELQALGLPKTKKEKERIWDLLTDELTGKQLRELDNLVKSEDADKSEKIIKILEELEKEKLVAIFLKLLTD